MSMKTIAAVSSMYDSFLKMNEQKVVTNVILAIWVIFYLFRCIFVANNHNKSFAKFAKKSFSCEKFGNGFCMT